MKEDAASLHKNILFVCRSNICRSPIAEGVFRHIAVQRNLLGNFTLDSAGLGSWHIGQPPDERAQAAMRVRGINISDLRGRRITPADFERFDLILAMDRAIRDALLTLAQKDRRDKVRLLMDYAPNLGVHEIPDPFFGQSNGFDYVCQLVDAACRGLLVSLTARPPAQATSASRPLVESLKG